MRYNSGMVGTNYPMNVGGGGMNGGGGGMSGDNNDMAGTHSNFSTPWSNPQFASNMMQGMMTAMMGGGMNRMGEQHGQNNQRPDYFGSAHASFSNRTTSFSRTTTPPQKKFSIEANHSSVEGFNDDDDLSDSMSSD